MLIHNKHDMTEYHFHDAAPTNDDGYPIHPEKGYPICGRGKSDSTTPNGKERDEPFCTLRAGWGAQGSGPGAACKYHGGQGGAPSGEANGSFEHGLYADTLPDAEAERARQWLSLSDGETLEVEDFVQMAEKALLFEFTRIERAMLVAPDPDLSNKYCCKYCGTPVPSREVLHCPNCDQPLGTPEEDIPKTAEWVDMHDRQISERVERWVDMLRDYKEIVDGSELNVNVSTKFEATIRRAEQIAESEPAEKMEFLYGEVDE